MAIAEKHEMAGFHPIQQLPGFADFIRGQRRRVVRPALAMSVRACSRIACQSATATARPPAWPRSRVWSSCELRRIGLAIDLVELPGLRVACACACRGLAELDEPAAAVAPNIQNRDGRSGGPRSRPAEDDAERVNEKRRVVRDDHHDRVRRLEAVLLRQSD